MTDKPNEAASDVELARAIVKQFYPEMPADYSGRRVQIVLAALATRKHDPSALVEAITGIADDYMTSDEHHPDYVLIPAERFEKLRAAEEAFSAREAGQ